MYVSRLAVLAVAFNTLALGAHCVIDPMPASALMSFGALGSLGVGLVLSNPAIA